MNNFIQYISTLSIALLFTPAVIFAQLPLVSYYDYDQQLPLTSTVKIEEDSMLYSLSYVTFQSTHEKKVTGLLSVPKDGLDEHPAVILMHGLGDSKRADYVEYGNQVFLKNGYAVLRLDIAGHGDRKTVEYPFSMTNGYRYWSRDIMSQTVFDLRRSVDFLETQDDIDPDRIGYLGISLGGIIGTVFCAVENRIKVPVIVIAGGAFKLMFGAEAESEETTNYLSIIEPTNFVKKISPRPLLMINAENDEVVPPITSNILFNTAEDPKEIIWYPSKHRDIPVDGVYGDGVNWFDNHLK